MSALFALDTNILVYALSPTEELRRDRALEIVVHALASNAIVPVQVLGEFLNVCRKRKLADPAAALDRVIEWLPLMATPATQVDHLVEAAGLSGRYGLQFFDALICTVAGSAGARYLLTEDMQDGLALPLLTIANPFAPANTDLIKDLLA